MNNAMREYVCINTMAVLTVEGGPNSDAQAVKTKQCACAMQSSTQVWTDQASAQLQISFFYVMTE